MPSLRRRRVEQAQRGNVVSEKLPGGITPSQASWRDHAVSSGSFSRGDSTDWSSSSGSVVAFCAGHNALVRGQDGALHAGRLLSASGARIIDASASVRAAPSSARREVFMPQWKVNLQARERYSKPLPQRYADGALRTRIPVPERHSHVGKDSLDRRPSSTRRLAIR